MKRSSACCSALVGLLLLLLGPAVATAAGEGEVVRRILDRKAASVVFVKFVLHVQISMGGQTREQEISGRVNGIVVDDEGLVLVPAAAFKPQVRTRRGPQPEMQATPSDVRVVFPGDPKEYEALVGATDSRLGLAFVRIKDLGERKVQPADFGATGKARVGDRLYGVSRLMQEFDYAPFCDTVDVVGEVHKPRKLMTLRGRFLEIGHPLYLADGKLAGFVIMQEGVGGGRAYPFLLDPGVVKATVDRAAKEARRVLEEAQEAEAEAAESEAPKEQPAAPADEDE